MVSTKYSKKDLLYNQDRLIGEKKRNYDGVQYTVYLKCYVNVYYLIGTRQKNRGLGVCTCNFLKETRLPLTQRSSKTTLPLKLTRLPRLLHP